MKIAVRTGKAVDENLPIDTSVVQETVSFLYVVDGTASSGAPSKTSYASFGDTQNGVVILNYTEQTIIGAALGVTTVASKFYSTVTIYKREVWEGGGETTYHPVALGAETYSLYDFNVANNRQYEYIVYPSSLYDDTSSTTSATTSGEYMELKFAIKTKWDHWSITELHPVEGSNNRYTADSSDVWLFKYNVEGGSQTQNLSKTQQNNLTAYPTFAHGPLNHIGGSVTCLLGSEMVAYEYSNTSKEYTVNYNKSTGAWEEEWKTIFGNFRTGGYKEEHPFVTRLSSNEKIDMLRAWRDVCYSGNPKLLKDIKGQKFLIQITESSNTTQYNWNSMPDTISFTWVEIGDLEDIIITSSYSTDIEF